MPKRKHRHFHWKVPKGARLTGVADALTRHEFDEEPPPEVQSVKRPMPESRKRKARK